MLQTLRENAAIKKVVLWLVVLGLGSGAGIGVTAVYDYLASGKSATAAAGPWVVQLGGETVTPIAFQYELRNVAREMTARGQGDLPDFQRRVQYETLSRLVRKTLELQEARKVGLTVTDREVSERITSLPELQRNGRFVGREEYMRTLAGMDIDVGAFENQIREGILIDKWEALVGGAAVVTDREVDEEFARRNEKVRFDYVQADTPPRAASTPTDAEIKAFYESHPERYQRTEARRARYILIDEKSVEAQVPAPAEGEVRAAYDADRTRYAGDFAKERPEIQRQIAYQRGQAEIDRRAAQLRANVTGADALDEAAARSGLRVEDTGAVRRDPDGLSKLGPEFIEALFRAPQGTVEGPVRMLRGGAVFVLSEIQPPHRATIEEARSEIVTDLSKEKARDAALATARTSVSSSGGDLTAVARALGATVQNGKLVGRGEPIAEIGYEPSVEKAAFATEPNRIAEPVATSAGRVLVLKVVEKRSADPTLLAAEREKIRSELRRTREYMLVNSVLDAAMKRTEFKSNDDYFKQLGS